MAAFHKDVNRSSSAANTPLMWPAFKSSVSPGIPFSTVTVTSLFSSKFSLSVESLFFLKTRKRTSFYSVDLQHSTVIPDRKLHIQSEVYRLRTERHHLVHLFAVVNIPQKVGDPQDGWPGLSSGLGIRKPRVNMLYVTNITSSPYSAKLLEGAERKVSAKEKWKKSLNLFLLYIRKDCTKHLV